MSRRGLTVIEVLVAMTMLAIIGAAVVAFLPTLVGVNRDAADEQRVTAAGKAFFEGVAALPAPAALEEGTYPAGATLGGSAVPVPAGCRAEVARPEPALPIVRVTLACEGAVDQVLERAGAAP